MRLQPRTGPIQPYADALVGFKYFFTETSVDGVDFGDDDVIASSTNLDDAAFSYGFGAGIDIEVFNGMLSEKSPGQVYINLGARYLYGAQAEYLEKGAIQREGGRVILDPVRSQTNMLLPQLGVTFRF